MRSVPVMDCGDGIFRADNGGFGKFTHVTAAARTLEAEETGTIFTNHGSALDLTITLPAPKEGLWFGFQKSVIDKDIIINTDVAGTKVHGGAGATQGVTVTNSTDTQYGTCALYCDGYSWFVCQQNGTWAIS